MFGMDREKEKLKWARHSMVERQLVARGISDPGVLRAMREVPRHRFVPARLIRDAYDDRPLPIGDDQTISQPYIVALMLEELNCHPSDRVLDVGAGSGYQTALLARLAGWVYAIERIESLAVGAREVLASLDVANVTLEVGDGSFGWAAEAPFDGIICGAAAPEIPPAWMDQLADGGRIVAPVGSMEDQMLVVITRTGDEFHRRNVCGVRFVKLIGRGAWPEDRTDA